LANTHEREMNKTIFMIAFKDQPVTFKCNSTTTAKWFHDRTDLSSNVRVDTQTEQSLTILGVKGENVGTYYCLGTDGTSTIPFLSPATLILKGT